MRVAARLAYEGIDFEPEFRFHPTRKWRADFHVPPLILVEVEGGVYHARSGHRSVTGILRDIEKYNASAALGYRIIRVSEKDLHGPNQWLVDLKTCLETPFLRGGDTPPS